MSDKYLELASQIETEYQEGLNYIKQMQFMSKWPEYERFKAGDQWPQVTEKTKNLPRPVFNIIDYIENHKVASVMAETLKMVFTSQEVPDENSQGNEMLQMAADGSDKFTKYSDTVWENIQQDMLNEEVLESASNLGTGIVHYYWDNDVKGGVTTKYIGDIKGETLDPINVFLGNPQQKDIQKQPFIIISSRELVSNVKAEAKAKKIPQEYTEKITPDTDTENEGYDSAKVEVNGSKKVTLLTKYYKKDGQVYYTKVCSGVVVCPETNTQLSMYPIAVMRWKNRKKSFYGVGDTEGLIPNQKGINFLLAMMLLSSQNTAWPKLISKMGALQQQITNAPGEIIYDHYMGGGDGIKYMQTGHFSAEVLNLVDKFIDITKSFSGAQDAATGDMNTSNNTATGIMLLQKAAGVPIESIKKRYYRFVEDVGRIWAEFWKVKYVTTRMIKVKDDMGNEVMQEFNGSQYKDIEMNLKIDIGPASSFSESLAQSSLDKLFDGGHITLEQYLEYVPKNVMPFKDRLKKEIEEMKANQQPDINQILQMLSPEEQQAFMNAPPEKQQAIMQEFMQSQQMNSQTQAPQMMG